MKFTLLPAFIKESQLLSNNSPAPSVNNDSHVILHCICFSNVIQLFVNTNSWLNWRCLRYQKHVTSTRGSGSTGINDLKKNLQLGIRDTFCLLSSGYLQNKLYKRSTRLSLKRSTLINQSNIWFSKIRQIVFNCL